MSMIGNLINSRQSSKPATKDDTLHTRHLLAVSTKSASAVRRMHATP